MWAGMPSTTPVIFGVARPMLEVRRSAAEEGVMDSKIEAIVHEKGGRIERVDPGTTVHAAVALMNQHVIGSLMVFEADRLVGIFTERDVLTRVIGAGRDPTAVRVGEVMTRELLVVEHGTTVQQAMTLMTSKRCRHLPVVDGGRVVGLISIGDLTRWVIRHQELAITDLTDYIHRA